MAVKPTPRVRKLVIIEESLLSTMAHNPVYLKEFPFLKAIQGQAARTGCGSCGSRAADTSRATVFTSAKQVLASMADDKRRKLKQLLNAQQVRVSYKQGSRIIQHTF